MVSVTLTETINSTRSPVRLNLHLDTTLQISAQEARRLVNHRIVPEIGTGLVAGEPDLTVSETDVIWRVPLHLSLPGLGELGQVGTVDVDALTGDILEDHQAQERMIQHARRLYNGATLSTK
jgi:hypothetical protein